MTGNIKELSEFEIAAFQDQANYIKVYTPTNEYVKTYSNLFSEVLNINPANAFQDWLIDMYPESMRQHWFNLHTYVKAQEK